MTNPGNQTSTSATAVSLQIHATDSARGQTLTYTATGLPAGLSINPSRPDLAARPTTAGTSTVTVTATDTTGASGQPSFTWTVTSADRLRPPDSCSATPASRPAPQRRGPRSAGVIDSSTGQPAHTGTWKAWLDGYGTTHTDTLSQAVTHPVGCENATFSFWLHIDTAETTTTTALRHAQGAGAHSSGAVLATVGSYSNANAASGYQQHSANLAAYVGKTITLEFTGSEDGSLQTSFVVDDTALNVS